MALAAPKVHFTLFTFHHPHTASACAYPETSLLVRACGVCTRAFVEDELAVPCVRVEAEDVAVHVAHGNGAVGQFGEGAEIARAAVDSVVAQLPLVKIQLIDAREGGGEPHAARAVEADVVDVVALDDGIGVSAAEMRKCGRRVVRVVDIETVVDGREHLASVGQQDVVHVVASVGDVAALYAYLSCAFEKCR